MKDTMKKHAVRKVQYLITLSVSLASFTVAASAAWPTPVITKLISTETPIQITDNEIAWVMGMNAPGHIVGSMVMSSMADRLGRRATLLIGALPFAFGSLLISFGLKPWFLYVGRFMWGIGTGLVSTVMTIYLNEIADKEIRATLSVFTNIVFNLGLLMVSNIGNYVSYECLNYMLLALPIIFFVACFWIPESPYYHLKENRVDAAKKELMRIRRCNVGKELEDELKSLRNSVSSEMRYSTTYKELFTGRQYRRAIIVAAGLHFTKTMTGVTVIRQYLGKIIKQSKSNLDYKTVITVYSLVQFVTSIMSTIIADRVGRRPLLYYSLFGSGLCLAIISVYFLFVEVLHIDQQVPKAFSYVLFAAFIGADVISNLGYLSIFRIIPAEIFPINVKANAMSSLNIFAGTLGFGMARGYQAVVNCAGFFGAFTVFTSFSIAGALFAIFLVPETKGRSLKDIQINLQGDIYNEAENNTLNQVIDSEVSELVENNEMKEIKLRENNVKF